MAVVIHRVTERLKEKGSVLPRRSALCTLMQVPAREAPVEVSEKDRENPLMTELKERRYAVFPPHFLQHFLDSQHCGMGICQREKKS